MLGAALSGDRNAAARLVEELAPVVQARIARMLLRYRPSARGRELRQELEDLVQEVFASLFADGARVLRAWDPARGMSLQNFVGLVAERGAASILRTGKRSPWTEDPTLDADIDRELAGSQDGLRCGAALSRPCDAESVTASRQVLEHVLRRLKEELSPLGWRLFELLFVDGLDVAEVCSAASMSKEAVWAWRSRLSRRSREIVGEIMSGAEGHSQTPS